MASKRTRVQALTSFWHFWIVDTPPAPLEQGSGHCNSKLKSCACERAKTAKHAQNFRAAPSRGNLSRHIRMQKSSSTCTPKRKPRTVLYPETILGLWRRESRVIRCLKIARWDRCGCVAPALELGSFVSCPCTEWESTTSSATAARRFLLPSLRLYAFMN